MKHQYFGDVNDYVKYGLLRCFSQVGLSIGVCWMLTPDDQRPDGRKIQYLSRSNEWKNHDPNLFDHLQRTLNSPDGRHLRHIEGLDHIPRARFFNAVVPDSRSDRLIWFRNMRGHLDDSDLVFFDPDNGIEVPSKRIGQKGSSKYIYWKEVTETWEHSGALLIYQHFPRVKRNEYISARVEEMQSHLFGSLVIPLRSSNVLFLLAYRMPGASHILEAIRLIEMRWARRIWRHHAT